MNFVEKIPLFTRFDIILIIIDQLIKQAVFILAHNTIIFDCDLKFVLNIFCFSGIALNICDDHTKGDSQIEYTNQTLE